MLLNSSLRTPFVQPNQSAPVGIPGTKAPEAPIVPFARLPHAILGDTRLSPTDRLIAAAILFWACDRPSATMSNNSIGKLLGLSLSVIERGMRALKQSGYVTADVVKPSPANMTGRVIHLTWVLDPSVLPACPDRRTLEGGGLVPTPINARGTIATDGPSVEQGPSPQTGGPVARDGEGPSPQTVPPTSPATDKEDRFVKKPKNLENARTGSEPAKRQRLLAMSQPVAPVAATISDRPSLPLPEPTPSPLARTLDRAMAQASQAMSMAAEPINAGPGELLAKAQYSRVTGHLDETVPEVDTCSTAELTAGQRLALGAMTDAERSAFERKSPGMRAQILSAFTKAFEPKVFERVTRAQLLVPRFVAQERPVERTTAGLMAAVAGGDPRLVIDLAESLCRDLGGAGDRRRWGALHALAKQVLDRAVAAEAVLDALRQAKGPKVENPGAVFTYALRAHGWRP